VSEQLTVGDLTAGNLKAKQENQGKWGGSAYTVTKLRVVELIDWDSILVNVDKQVLAYLRRPQWDQLNAKLISVLVWGPSGTERV
jgi:hypothetical protein